MIDEYVTTHKLTPMTLKDVLSVPLAAQEVAVQNHSNPQ